MTTLNNYPLDAVRFNLQKSLDLGKYATLAIVAAGAMLILRIQPNEKDILQDKSVKEELVKLFDSHNGTQSVYRKACLRLSIHHAKQVKDTIKKAEDLEKATSMLVDLLKTFCQDNGQLYGKVFDTDTLLPKLELLEEDEIKLRAKEIATQEKANKAKAAKAAKNEAKEEVVTSSESPENAALNEPNYAGDAIASIAELQNMVEDFLLSGNVQLETFTTDFLAMITGLVPMPEEADEKTKAIADVFAMKIMDLHGIDRIIYKDAA